MAAAVENKEERASEGKKEEEKQKSGPVVLAYWHPNLTLNWVYDDMKLAPHTLPPQAISRML